MDAARVAAPAGPLSRAPLLLHYAPLLGLTDLGDVVTLDEGYTPLVRSRRIGPELSVELYFKVEGANPTGSFKDRGMTAALTLALRRGARAIVCASTGNTAASAAAYAARAGIPCHVLLPAGAVAVGKLAQALAFGARVLAVEGGFDAALDVVRQLPSRLPLVIVNSTNPDRLLGQRTVSFEVVDQLGEPPQVHALPVGNAGNITATFGGYRRLFELARLDRLPRMMGFQAEGAAPIVRGQPVTDPRTVATAIRIGNPASWQGALEAVRLSGGSIEAVSDAQILAAYRDLAHREGIFCEPASAAGLAGVVGKARAGMIERGSIVVVTLTGNGLKDPDTAVLGVEEPRRVGATLDAVVSALGGGGPRA